MQHSLSSAAKYGAGERTERPSNVTPINEEDSGQLSAKVGPAKTSQERRDSIPEDLERDTIDDLDVEIEKDAAVEPKEQSAIKIVQGNAGEKPGRLCLNEFDVSTKEGFRELMRFQMRIFDSNYDFESDSLVGGEATYSENPTLEELYYFCKYIIISGRMEKEIPILCLVYIERFLTKSGVLMNFANWKRLTLISLILASKIWDDDSLENVHFPQVLSDVSLKEITALEKVFLQIIDFDLVIKGSEYAKYYFILKAFAKQFNSTLPMGPISVPEMSQLQNNTVKAESELRDKYNRKMRLQQSI